MDIASISSNKKGFLHKPLFHTLLIAIIGLLIYSNTLNSPFLWDDDWLIVENSRIKDLSNFTDLSGTRYLTYLSFAINYKINGLNVAGYHVFNITVHLLNAILIYLLITVIFRTPFFSPPFNSPLSKGGYRRVALFSGLIFVSHPVYTMAITNINQRSILLATFFYLLSLVTYIKWRLRDNSLIPENRSGVSPDSQAGSLTYNKGSCPSPYALYATHYTLYSISVISAVLAMKCKEVAITLPIIMLLSEHFLFRDKWKKSIIYIIPILLTLLIIPLSTPQVDVFGAYDPSKFRIEDKSILSGIDAGKLSNISRKDYTLTGFRAILTYIRLFFLPFNLNFDYDYPTFSSFLEPNVILSFLFVLTIFSVSIFLFYRSRLNPSSPPFRKEGAGGFSDHRLISFGVFWFFITLSIESFIVVLNYPIFEYRLYLPSIGILLLLAGLLGYVRSHLRDRSLYIFKAAIIVVLIFLVATYVRNEVLKDEIALWKDVIRKSPQRSDAYYNLGIIYHEQGRFIEAVHEYKTALKLNPNQFKIHNNLGNTYYAEGLLDEAIQEYKIALMSQPDSEIIHINLGSAYLSNGQLNEAVQEFKIALKINPYFAGAHYSLGNAYIMQNRIELALKEYNMAIGIKPDFAEAHYKLGTLYFEQGHLDKALKEYRDVVRLKPDFAEAYYNLGNIYFENRQLNDAIIGYQIALRLKPDFTDAHYNLGNAYFDLGQMDEALREYQTVIRLRPDFAEAYSNLGAVYSNIGQIDEAIKAYKTALGLKPDYAPARKNLEMLYKEKKGAKRKIKIKYGR